MRQNPIVFSISIPSHGLNAFFLFISEDETIILLLMNSFPSATAQVPSAHTKPVVELPALRHSLTQLYCGKQLFNSSQCMCSLKSRNMIVCCGQYSRKI